MEALGKQIFSSQVTLAEAKTELGFFFFAAIT